MKKILLLFLLPVLLLAAALPVSAQSRKALIEKQRQEIQQLQFSLDSLQALLDSLRGGIPSMEPISQEVPAQVFPRREELSPEQTDSLMHLWFSQMDTEDQPSYDMDAERFTSDVPDSELERRLEAMNSYITLPFNATVKNYMVLYSEKMRSGMRTLLGKSEYYFPIFEEVLTRYGLPLELKYMAVIESHLNPVACSKAGAMGLWQFMYGTAKGYGLKINSFVDERLDVRKSTDAAARYLRDAYRVFGDWNLAICSYNCGAANVQKAIKRSGSTRFWDIYDFLPRETRGYVPAFVGAMYAFTYSREYGLEPAEVGMPAVCDTFHIVRNLHFKQISETTGIPADEIKALNPQYLHDIIPGSEGMCVLKLPLSRSAAFMEVPSDSLYNHKSAELLNPQVLKNISESGREVRIAYKVKSGDILGRIAIRNGVTVAQIKKWNHMKSDTIRPGQILYIYKKQ